MRAVWMGLGVIGVVGVALVASGAKLVDEAAKPEFFTVSVKPILQANCYRCHGDMNHRGGLNMNTRELLLKGGHHGAAIVPGDPAKSLLVTLIRHEGPAADPMSMPPRGKLTDEEIAIVERWVKAGALMPEDAPKAP